MPSNAPAPKTRRKRVPADRILDAACREFAAVGYQAAAVDRIAADAATTKTTIYSRFGSKPDLFRAAHQRETEHLREHLLRAYDTDERRPLAERLHIYVHAYFELQQRRPDGFKLLFVTDGEAGHLQSTVEVLTERIAEIVVHEAGGAVVGDLQRLIASLIVGAVHHGAGAAAAAGVDPTAAATITELFLASAIEFDRAEVVRAWSAAGPRSV